MLTLTLLLSFQLVTGTASDLAIPQRFRITGKVVVGQDEPVMVVLTLRSVSGEGSQSVQSFSNGTFRFDSVLLGTYRLEVVDPRYAIYDRPLLLREPADTGNHLTVRLTRLGESSAPPELDIALYSIDAETLAATSPKVMEDFNKGVSALRNPARNNPAEPHFKRAAAAAPKFYEAHLLLGLEQLRQNKTADAIQTLERAAAIKPAEARPLSMLGKLYFEGEKFQNAADTLSKLSELGKMSPADQYHLGSAFYRLNQLDRAREHLLAAIDSGNKAVPFPYLQLHNVYLKMNDPIRGLAILEDYLKLFPADPNHAAMADRARQMRARMGLPPPG